MRKLEVSSIIPKIESMCIEANYNASSSLMTTLRQAQENESSTLGQTILSQIIKNDEIATNSQVPMCQDTGIVVVFVEIGSSIQLIGNLEEAIHEITIAPKGAGSENVSAVGMLKPSDGYEGVKQFVLDTILKAGGNPCPPIIVGVGVGGNFEKCALLSKQALMRPLEDTSSDEICARLEKELLTEINELNIGPMGFGGSTTALAVKVNAYPCHIASLPVAVNIQCHASRHVTEIF